MKRIGTTDDGRILLEATAAELLDVDTAIVRLIQFRDACAATAPAELLASAAVARALEPKPKKILHRRGGKSAEKKTADGTKTCTECGEVKPASDFYTGHGKCKPCVLAKQKAAKATKAPKVTDAQKPDPTRFANVLSKTCATCKTEKNLSEFQKFARSCNECMQVKYGAVERPRGSTKSRLELIRAADRRAKLKAAPRERDPDLDRPVEGGRVLPVGGEG